MEPDQANKPELTRVGRPVHGPTPPGTAARCERTTALSDEEIDQVVCLIADARRLRTSLELPPDKRTRHWGSIMQVVQRLEPILGSDPAGWKIGAASKEIRQAEGVPEPSPGRLYASRFFESPARLPAGLFINHRNVECEFAFLMKQTLDPGDGPFSEEEIVEAVDSLFPVLEIGDTVFADWYGAAEFLGTCLDNGGGAALVFGRPRRDWTHLDMASSRVAISINGEYLKEGYGKAAMGHPLESLKWMVGWLNGSDRALRAGEVVSTGTCTGHCFVLPGDTVSAEFEDFGSVSVTFET